MQADLDLVELYEDELSVEVEVRVDGLLKDLEVVEDVLDEFALMVGHVPGELALEQAVVGLDEIEQSSDQDDLVLPVLLGHPILLLDLKHLVNGPVLLPDLRQDMPHALLVVVDSPLHLLHVEVTVSDILKQCARFVVDLM